MLAMNIIEVTIDELVERYSALLFDAYGVLSYTVGALPGAVDLIDRLNGMGKPYYVLTNDSSALPENRAARYRNVGTESRCKPHYHLWQPAGRIFRGAGSERDAVRCAGD